MKNKKFTGDITETELRALIFWAAVGINKSRGGSYYVVLDVIKKHHEMMPEKHKYRDIEFGVK